jgi:lipid-A-disaccharide synthase-like uncharacterized protein
MAFLKNNTVNMEERMIERLLKIENKSFPFRAKPFVYNNMNDKDLKIIPYTATSLSVVGRFIFMFLLYKNKSTNSLSLLFCILSIFSSSMWIYYSIQLQDLPMIVRSSIELTLLSLSSVYIIRNKVVNYKNQSHIQVHNNQILPLST